jgi:protease-4
MRRNRLLIVLLVLFLVAVLVTSVVGIGLMVKAGGVSVEKGSTLVVKLSGPLPEQPLPDQPFPGLAPSYMSVFEFDQVLQEAAFDDRIERLLIRLGGVSAGYGKVQELHQIIARFSRDSGKPTTCWLEMGSNKEYLIATACDEIFMAPEGFLLVNGMDISVTFYKDTLAKLGIEAEFTRAGKYKSAVEPLTRSEMSPAYREMLNSLADSIYTDFVDTIADARGLSPSEVRALIDDPPMTASGAQRAGLIDGLYYRDQLHAYLGDKDVQPISAVRAPLDLPQESATQGRPPAAEQQQPEVPDQATAKDSAPAPAGRGEVPAEFVGLIRSKAATEDSEEGDGEAAAEGDEEDEDDDPDEDDDQDEANRISFSQYQRSMGGLSKLRSRPRIAVIYCEGQIMSGSSDSGGPFGGATMGSTTIARAIRTARLDKRVKAIVLRVDSPGGSGLASDIIWRETQLARNENKKPVIVSMGDLAASGGYYIAMGADMIIAQPSTITGSIGVFAGKYNLAGLYEKIGLHSEQVKRGAMSDIFNPGKPLGEAGRAKLTEFVDEFYATFLRKAALGRGSEPEILHRVAQGRVWTGRQAMEIGLVDQLGSLRTAIAVAKEKAGITGEVALRVLPKRPNFIDELLGKQIVDVALLGAPGRSSVRRALGATPGLGTITRLLRAAPLLSLGTPILMAPYELEVH